MLKLPPNTVLYPMTRVQEIIKNKLCKPLSLLTCPRCLREQKDRKTYKPMKRYFCLHCEDYFTFVVFGDSPEEGIFKASLTPVH